MPMLNLSKAELDTLAQILRGVGGDPDNSRRKHADTLLEKVEKAGGEWISMFDEEYDTDGGSIFFLTEEEIRKSISPADF